MVDKQVETSQTFVLWVLCDLWSYKKTSCLSATVFLDSFPQLVEGDIIFRKPRQLMQNNMEKPENNPSVLLCFLSFSTF